MQIEYSLLSPAAITLIDLFLCLMPRNMRLALNLQRIT
jgi:hypothetical protein